VFRDGRYLPKSTSRIRLMTSFQRTCLVAALVVVSALPAGAQESGLSFLRIGTDAAAIALGDAHVAHSRDAFATYWNPAGLAAGTENTTALSHHVWVGDVRTYAFASRFRAGAKGGLGLFVTATGSGDLEAREGPGDPAGFFDAQFVSTGAAYGRAFGPVRLGVTAKYLSERIFSQSASGYAFDFGVQADVLKGGLQLGAALQNVGEMNELNAASTKLPRTLRVGAAVYPFNILAEDGADLFNLMVVAEVSHNFAGDRTQVHVGLAGEAFEMLQIRVGYLSNDALRDISFGAGLRFSNLHFDYALLPFSSGFGGAGHVLTLAYGW